MRHSLKRDVIACTSAAAPHPYDPCSISVKETKAPELVQMAYPRHLLARDLATFHEQGQQRHYTIMIRNCRTTKLSSDLEALFRSFYGQAT